MVYSVHSQPLVKLRVTKVCISCGIKKSVEHFDVRKDKSDGRRNQCRLCRKGVNKSYYDENSEVMKRQISAARKIRRLDNSYKLGDYLANHPCIDCGEGDIRVLDFDHTGLVKKRYDVTLMLRNGFSWSSIQAEIEKCEVRCRNCHAIKTYERMANTWRQSYYEENMLL